MKIALVILSADAKRGGAERYTVDLAAALKGRGHDVSVVASEFPRKVHPFKQVLLPATGFTRADKYKRFLDAWDAELTVEKYDVVHAMLPMRQCDLYHPHAGVAIEGAQKWNVVFNPRRRAMADVERELLTRAVPPVVLGLSNYVNEHIRRFYPDLSPDRLVRLFNAVDLSRFSPPAQREPRDEVRGLIIANDFERKGVPQAVRAVELINDDRLTLDVVGKGTARTTHKSVRVHGQVSDPRAMYANADFFVLPTRHDPCSLVVLEALAMGLPVISTKFNGACEIMTDGVHGFVLDDPNDIPALETAMRAMLDTKRREEMSKACLALRPELSYEHHLDQLEAIYQQIVARAPRPC